MASKYFLISAVLVLSLCAWCEGRSSDCGSKVGEIVDLEVTGCAKTAAKCTLKRNTNATLELTFKALKDTKTLTAVVHGIILGVPMPFDLPNPDACKDCGIECPIKAGETYKYTASFPISPSYPRVTVDVKWELQTGEEEDVICALVPSKIS